MAKNSGAPYCDARCNAFNLAQALSIAYEV